MARRRRSLANWGVALASVLVSLVLAELGCQLYARLVIFSSWDRDMRLPRHFLARSQDPILAYELASGFEIETDGRRLRINRFGLRADWDEVPSARWRIAILGDSVTMGAGHSQERTIDRLLEARLREAGIDAAVLNFGVPGYATRELLRFLSLKAPVHRPHHVLYLLNPNDFSRRDSVYEGADNGLYRMYVRPSWLLPWFLRKGAYRLHKRDAIGWYRWLFAANESGAQADIRAMVRESASGGAGFSVVLLPSGAAYGPNDYALDEMVQRIVAFLEAEQVAVLAPIDEFRDEPARFFDDSDHLWDAGNQRMAEILERFLIATGAVPPGGVPSASVPPRGR